MAMETPSARRERALKEQHKKEVENTASRMTAQAVDHMRPMTAQADALTALRICQTYFARQGWEFDSPEQKAANFVEIALSHYKPNAKAIDATPAAPSGATAQGLEKQKDELSAVCLAREATVAALEAQNTEARELLALVAPFADTDKVSDADKARIQRLIEGQGGEHFIKDAARLDWLDATPDKGITVGVLQEHGDGSARSGIDKIKGEDEIEETAAPSNVDNGDTVT